MIRRFLVITLLLFPLLAIAQQEDPFSKEDLTTFHHVNVITGNLNLSSKDGPIIGAQSLMIPRTYTSAGALERGEYNTLHGLIAAMKGGLAFQGGWTLFPEVAMVIDLADHEKAIKIHLSEPDGQYLSYEYSHKCPNSKSRYFFKPIKKIEQTSGVICKRTNPSYNLIKLSLKKGEATVFLPNGGKRLYKSKNHVIGKVESYFLEEEKKPSGHRIRYLYRKNDIKLRRIEALSPCRGYVYASLDLSFSFGKNGPLKLICKGSDGKTLEYHSIKHEGRDYLKKVVGNFLPHEIFHYEPSRKGIGARISSFEVGGKQVCRAVYYAPQKKKDEEKILKKPKSKPFHIDKVEKIYAPVGSMGEDVLVAHFTYHKEYTDVRDADGLLIRYHHDSKKLTRIEYYDENNRLRTYQKLYWQGGLLICKALFDGNHCPLFAKTFRYENDHVVEEVLWGTLTGHQTTPLEIDPHGQPSGGESYRKSYTYSTDGFNLLIREKEEEGVDWVYRYKPGTDLISAKLALDKQGTILKREFFFYNSLHLLIRDFSDDGSSSQPTDDCNVTYRHEIEYQHNPTTKLPSVIAESYWDPTTQEKHLLKAVKLTHIFGRVAREEVCDQWGTLRYKLFTYYNKYGQITRKTTPLGKENTYRYNEQGLLEESKEVGSARKLFSYDRANRLISCSEPESHKCVKTTYDPKGRAVSQTDPVGNTTFHCYDGFGNRIATKLPCSVDEKGQEYSPTLKFQYDVIGNLVQAELPLEEQTRTSYNFFKKPLLIIHPDQSRTQHFYNKNGSLKKTVYGEGTEVHFTYNLFQQMTSKKTFSGEGKELLSEIWEYKGTNLIAYTNENGLRVQFSYDGAGRKTSEIAEGRQVSFSYDSLGYLERTDYGEWASVQKHNIEGLVEETWEEDPSGKIENKMTFHYNGENQKERVCRITTQGEAIDLLSYKDGKLICHTDPLGEKTHFIYDFYFQNSLRQNVLQKTTIDPLGHRLVETYDAQNRLFETEKKDASGNTVFKESLFYDQSGNLAKHLSFVYQGNLPEKEVSVQRTFDSMGRIVEEVESDQKKTSYRYDVRGNLILKTLPNQVELHYSYDGACRMEEIKASDETVHYRYLYGQEGQPIEIIDSLQGSSLKRRYNRFGQVIAETNFLEQTESWSYDSQGRCTSLTLPDSSSIRYQYKGAHMERVQRHGPSGYLLYKHTYLSFDPNGHISEEDLICGLGSLKTSRDLLERPSIQSSSIFEQGITYGPSGLVENVSHSFFGEKEYEYDPLDQLSREGETHYAFDSLGNPLDCEVNALNQICATPEHQITYDLNGNPEERTGDDPTIQYTFDALGRLIEMTIGQEKKISFSYDPLSRLFSKEIYSPPSSTWYQSPAHLFYQEPSTTAPGEWKLEKKVYYLYDREWEIGTIDTQGRIRELKVLGLGIKGDIGGAVSIELDGIPYAPLHDFQGSIIAILSPSGEVEEKYEIDSFGKEKASSPKNPWRFASKRSEEGLIFFGLRFYDPTLGRWLTPDPAGFGDGINLYAYVHNSPLNRLDLFGLNGEPNLQTFRLDVPIPQIPRFAGVQSFMARGEINGVSVDFFLSCGHWHQLQFTPEEQSTNQVNLLDHLPELISPEGLYVNICTAHNGINTTIPEFGEMCDSLKKEIGGTLFIGFYNPTEGLLNDMKRVREEMRGVETKQISLTRQFMVTIGEKVHNINPQSIWYAIDHSEAGLIMKRAIQGMDEGGQTKLRSLLHILAVAPAEPLSNDQGASVINVYSEKDFVTGYGSQGQVSLYQNHPDYSIEILKCISPRSDRNGWIADHGFLKPTYKNAWGKNIERKKDKFAFYQGESHGSR